jgi:hypothetical protein
MRASHVFVLSSLLDFREFVVDLAQLCSKPMKPGKQLVGNVLGDSGMFFHHDAKSIAVKRERPQPLARGDRDAMHGLNEHSEFPNQRSGPQILNEFLTLLGLGAAGFPSHDKESGIPLFALRDQVFASFEKALLTRARNGLKLVSGEPGKQWNLLQELDFMVEHWLSPAGWT